MNNQGGGVSVTGVVFIVFLVLKLTGVIDWSWWWVTAPIWGMAALAALLFAVALTIAAAKR